MLMSYTEVGPCIIPMSYLWRETLQSRSHKQDWYMFRFRDVYWPSFATANREGFHIPRSSVAFLANLNLIKSWQLAENNQKLFRFNRKMNCLILIAFHRFTPTKNMICIIYIHYIRNKRFTLNDFCDLMFTHKTKRHPIPMDDDSKIWSRRFPLSGDYSDEVAELTEDGFQATHWGSSVLPAVSPGWTQQVLVSSFSCFLRGWQWCQILFWTPPHHPHPHPHPRSSSS